MNDKVLTWIERWRLNYNSWLVLSLARTMFWSDKFSQRFSVLGLSVVSAIIVTLMFGANTKRTMIYQLFALFVAMVLMAMIVVFIQSYVRKKQINISRCLPTYATVEVPFSYRVEIKNLGNKDIYNI